MAEIDLISRDASTGQLGFCAPIPSIDDFEGADGEIGTKGVGFTPSQVRDELNRLSLRSLEAFEGRSSEKLRTQIIEIASTTERTTRQAEYILGNIIGTAGAQVEELIQQIPAAFLLVGKLIAKKLPASSKSQFREDLEKLGALCDAAKIRTEALETCLEMYRIVSKYHLQTEFREHAVARLNSALRGYPHIVPTDRAIKCQVKKIRKLLAVHEKLNIACAVLCLKNLGVVDSALYKYRDRPVVARSDLTNIGFIGLMRSALQYNPTFKVRFSTYARWWVDNEIQREFPKVASLCPISQKAMREVYRALEKMREWGSSPLNEDTTGPTLQLWTKLSADRELDFRDFEISDFAIYLRNVEKRSPKLIERMLETRIRLLNIGSIDGWVSKENRGVKDELCAPDNLADEQARESRNFYIKSALRKLPIRSRLVLQARFGIGRNVALTLEETGALLKFSRERARQIQVIAFRELKAVISDDVKTGVEEAQSIWRLIHSRPEEK